MAREGFEINTLRKTYKPFLISFQIVIIKRKEENLLGVYQINGHSISQMLENENIYKKYI